MIRQAGRGSQHRYYVIEKGTHVDSLYDEYPDKLRPILPCFRAAFVALEGWVERGVAPPDSQTVPSPDPLNRDAMLHSCALGPTN